MEQLAQAVIAAMASQSEGYKASDVYETMQEGLKLAMERLMQFDEIRSRGVEKISFISADGLSGLERAVVACFGKETVFQRCIVHMVRNSLKYLPRSD